MGEETRALELQVAADGGVAAGRLRRDRPAPVDFDVEVRSEADVEQLVALVRRLLERTAQLEHALSSRVAIEQAKGILAERLRTEPESAFELLRRAARNNRMPIHELAGLVIARAETPRELEDVLSRS